MGLGALLGIVLAIVPVAVQVYEASAREQELQQDKVEFDEQRRQFEVDQARHNATRAADDRMQDRAIIREKMSFLEGEIARAAGTSANDTATRVEAAQTYRQRAASAFLHDDLEEADACIRTADASLQGWPGTLTTCEDRLARLARDNAALQALLRNRPQTSEAQTPVPAAALWVSVILLTVAAASRRGRRSRRP